MAVSNAEVMISERRKKFEGDGYLLVKGFASREECAGLKSAMQELIRSWDPDKTLAPVFCTDETNQLKNQAKSDYFLDSADRVHFFLEKGAAGEDGRLKAGIAKARSLNKVGHGLHVVDPAFRSYSHSAKVMSLVEELGWQDPVLPQSMYIFKQPVIGGEVTSHQDSTFLYTTPRPTCLGLWLAIDAATLNNGCLWARPGSHREPVRRVFARNPKRFPAGAWAGVGSGDPNEPQMVFEPGNVGDKTIAWEGKMPEGWERPSGGLLEKGFKSLECEVGDLVVIHGQLDHMSLPNRSSDPRETFQLHLVEGPSAEITWSERNWLQYPDYRPFPSLKTSRATEDNSHKRKADSL